VGPLQNVTLVIQLSGLLSNFSWNSYGWIA
jgi:hypothetical protein